MKPFLSVNPASGEVLATIEQDSPEAVERKLARAADCVQVLRTTDFAQRASWMRDAAALMVDETQLLAGLITQEMGKPFAQAVAEVTKSAHAMRFYADYAEEFLRPRQLEDASTVGAQSAGAHYEPLGAILAVMPWNYPVWQVIRFAAPALMAGNVGVLKHASNVPSVALYLHELFTRAGFPEGAFSTLMIDSSRVAEVIRDRRIAAVTLTGSEPAGQSVAQTAGSVLKKCVLELGGSDPFIVMPSADLDAASTMAVRARTANNGQACINAKRFLVHADVYDAFTELFTAKMAALTVGDPMDAGTDIGPVATERGRHDLHELVEDARAHGAQISLGGQLGEGSGWFYPPTVISGITRDMRIFEEEAFGPVASLYSVGSYAEAIELANVLDYGLGSAFWSTDAREIERAQRDIEAGAVFINGMTISYPELPFGGIKRSGFGRELSAEGIREFCNLKTTWIA